jgi:hypothetical protein
MATVSLHPNSSLTVVQNEFMIYATEMIWNNKVDRIVKEYDNLDIIVYRLPGTIRIDIRLKGLQPT